MEYNIFTTANNAYFPFLDIFINSINKNSNKVKNIIVVDTGLTHHKEYITSLDKVILIDSKVNEVFTGVHSVGWYNATSIKTKKLLELFNNDNYNIPTILMDSDVYVDKELVDLIDLSYDIQVMDMDKKNQHTRSDGIFLKQIACFVIFNQIKKSKVFLSRWINEILNLDKLGIALPHETPAFNKVISDSNFVTESFIKLKHLRERVACSDMVLYDDSYSLHFKSNGSTKTDKITNFISRVQNCTSYKNIKIDNYINKTQFNIWKNT